MTEERTLIVTTTQTGQAQHTVERPAGRVRLAIRWLLTLRWHLFALFASDLGRSMVDRKYDAFTTDNAYDATPRGRRAIPRFVDRIVRGRDTNVALRQRLGIVTGVLTEAALIERTGGPVRIASGPVGLGRDIRQTWSRLRALGTRPDLWLELVGVDLDDEGIVLAEAARLAESEDIPLSVHRLDLLRPDIGYAIGGPVEVFNSIGLGVWLDDGQFRNLLWTARSVLSENGVLVIDHWRRHGGAKYVGALQMPARYLTDDAFEAALSAAGFTVEEKRATANGVVVVYRARRSARIG